MNKQDLLKYLEEKKLWYRSFGTEPEISFYEDLDDIMGHVKQLDEPQINVERKQTNGDRIRAMSNEQLAEYVHGQFKGCAFCIHYDFQETQAKCKPSNCKQGILEWLQSEVKEND